MSDASASSRACRVGPVTIGGPAADPSGPGLPPLAIIAGPCVLEDDRTNEAIAEVLVATCRELGLPLILKASFDKANRSSIRSHRGPGLEDGLRRLAALGRAHGVPVSTDVHEPEQAARAAEHADLLQVPAFLCRQTDLLVACARTGKPVNVKKGQFLSPAEMTHVLEKLAEAGAGDDAVMITERGTFFGYQRLVNDFIGVGDLMTLGPPVCFDATHSTQLPGAGAGVTAGRPERAPLLARAAVAAGVDAVFLECHPDPSSAHSDGATVQRLDSVPELLASLVAVRAASAEAVARERGRD